MQLWCDKGLCYYYDDKFSLSHKCINRYFLLLLIDVFEEPSQLINLPNLKLPEPYLLGDCEHHVSLKALNGSNNACDVLNALNVSYGACNMLNVLNVSYSECTMLFQCNIQGIKASIQLASGSSNNFMQSCIAQCLKLLIQANEQLQELVGNNISKTFQGFIVDLLATIQGIALVFGDPW